jgi:inhibitor of growth protein 3
MNSSNLNSGEGQAAVAAADVGAAEGGEAEGDGDDKTYCFCDGISYGEMIACDEFDCEREWVCDSIVLPRIGCEIDLLSLTVPSRVYWAYCASRWGMVL